MDYEVVEDEELTGANSGGYEVIDDPELSGSVTLPAQADDSGKLGASVNLDDIAADFGGVGIAGMFSRLLKNAPALVRWGGAALPATAYESTVGSSLRSGDQSGADNLANAALDAVGAGTASRIFKEAAPASRVQGSLNPWNNKSVVDAKTLADPNIRRNLSFVERTRPAALSAPVDKISRVGPATQSAVTSVNKLAEDPVKAVGAQLGAASGDNATIEAMTRTWQEKGPAIINDPIFQEAKSVPELVGLAAKERERAHLAKRQLIAEADNVIKVSPDEIVPYFSELEAQAAKWKQNSDTRPLGEALSAKLVQQRGDLREMARIGGGAITPTQLADSIENINYVRRQLLQEFDKNAIVGDAAGQAKALADRESISALSTVTSAMDTVLEQKIAEAAKAGALPSGYEGMFSKLNAQYGGFSALERLADRFAYQSQKGISERDLTRAVQTPGKEASNTMFNVNQSPRTTMANSVIDSFNRKADTLPPEGKEFARAVSRDEDAMSNIRDVLSASKQPARLPSHPDLGMSVTKATGLAGVRNLAKAALGTAVTGGTRALASPAEAMAMGQEVDPYQNGLPRRTEAWNDQTVLKFMADTVSKPTAPVAQGMVVKLKETLRAGDKSKAERVLADMAKLFPDVFEPGIGVNDKLFHVDDQQEYMQHLKSAYRNGLLDPSFIARQRAEFADKTSAKVLPVQPPPQMDAYGMMTMDKMVPRRMGNESPKLSAPTPGTRPIANPY